MARTVRDTNFETPRRPRSSRAARQALLAQFLESGLHLGYRRTQDGGGSWVARVPGRGQSMHERGLGARGRSTGRGRPHGPLRSQKPRKRRAMWWKARERAGSGSRRTIAPHGRRGARRLFRRSRTARLKGLGEGSRRRAGAHPARAWRVEPAKLTTKRIRDWQSGLGDRAQARSRPTASRREPKGRAVDTKDADAVRARRATANRTLTVLKAALNHAFHEGRVVSDDAWRKVKPFREADAPVVHFLSDDECRRIVNACDGAFRNIVKGALVSGCRYGELTRMRAARLQRRGRNHNRSREQVRQTAPCRADRRRPRALCRTDRGPHWPRTDLRPR